MPFKKPHHTAEPGNVEDIREGGKLIKPRGLNIVWGNDHRYWKVVDKTAELIQVSWLEVTGNVKVDTNHKKYKVMFRVRVKEEGFGWNNTNVLVMAKLGKRGNYKFKETTLKPDGKEITIPSDGDVEIEVTEKEQDIYFGLYEVWSGKWKGGLEIIDAKVVPV